jgi:hypothetical protein
MNGIVEPFGRFHDGGSGRIDGTATATERGECIEGGKPAVKEVEEREGQEKIDILTMIISYYIP